MSAAFTESIVEDDALTWLEEPGYAVLHGPGIATGGPSAERSDPMLTLGEFTRKWQG